MAPNRSFGRDVHFYDISKPDQELGGLLLTPSFTERTFLFALGILIISDSPYDVYLRGTDVPLEATDEPLQPGKYDIKPRSPHGNRLCLTLSEQCVRERDRKCAITGWYQLMSLMLSNIHEQFDEYIISINPDDDYRIVTFRDDIFNGGGRQLDPVCRDANSDQSARDELLRWHFRQALFANMRGAGEPIFETDFGSDMVGEILSGPQSAKRMEAELNSRLHGLSFV
ncbi:hypothetical protein V1524DRAFT_472965 [Lipomyces starkeyi]